MKHASAGEFVVDNSQNSRQCQKFQSLLKGVYFLKGVEWSVFSVHF